ncbi:MAG: recombinase family protein [Eubacteriaceae bacterium]|nr:recombinase family protein [Eubacteriaceae bacterium]
MNVAYIRVSTLEQNDGRQVEAMKDLGIEEYYTEKISAKDTDRPQLKAMLKFVRDNRDTVYIHSFDRLARSTKDLLDIVDQLQSKGVRLVSIKESFDTSTAVGKLMLTMIGAINTFERENMLERQREGIALAVQQGKYKGRKKIERPDNWDEIYNQYKTREITGTKAMELLGLTRNVFYQFKKDYEESH